jgi:Domain of unknown function (DUF4136)
VKNSAVHTLFRIAVPLALLTVTACAPAAFKAKVNRFQALPPAQGQSFAIAAADPKLQGSLEFNHYAALVKERLAALGYQSAASSEAANLVVLLDYGVDEGKERTRVVPGFGDRWYGGYYGDGFGYGGYGGGYGGYGYGHGYRGHRGYMMGFYDPFMFGGGYDQVEKYTVYTSGLDMKIETRADHKRLFEGKAEAMSLNNELTYLVPNLVEAMFTGFPGNSGETVKITVAQPKKK